MTYTKINLYLANGIPEALSNLWYGSDSAVVEIRDAVEDAKNGKDLLNRIQGERQAHPLQGNRLLGQRKLPRNHPLKARPTGARGWK